MRSSSRTWTAALLVALVGAAPGAAEDEATEDLHVEVLEVRTAPGDGRTAAARWVVALGRVLEATRSASGLAPGDPITIRYLYDPPPPKSRQEALTPMLVRGVRYRARLVPGGPDLFAPAPGPASLTRLPADPPPPEPAEDPPASPPGPASPQGPGSDLPLAVGVLMVAACYGLLIERIDTIPKRGLDP